MHADAWRLVEAMLAPEPLERATACQALCSPYIGACPATLEPDPPSANDRHTNDRTTEARWHAWQRSLGNFASCKKELSEDSTQSAAPGLTARGAIPRTAVRVDSEIEISVPSLIIAP